MKKKNLIPIATGTLFALVNVLFLAGIVEYISASVFGAHSLAYGFNFYSFYCEFEFAADASSVLVVFTYLSPLLYAMLMLEVANFFLRRSPVGAFRFGIIFFILINLGYLIAKIFYGGISLVLYNPGNKFVQMANNLELGKSGRVLAAFLLVILLIGFINYTTIKLNKYISQ